MKLTARPRSGAALRSAPRALTAEPGTRNPNGQIVVARTGAPSTTRDRQVIYHLRCTACAHDYGCNGMDIKARRCPRCQNGAPGEPLRASTQTTLFE